MIYYVLLLAVWAPIRIYVLDHSSMTPGWALTEALLKIAIWVLPLLIYLSKVERVRAAAYLKLDQRIPGWRWVVIPVLLLALFVFIVDHLLYRFPFVVTANFTDWLNGFLLAGIIEEIIFRGFILNKLTGRFAFWRANIFTSVLYVGMLLPMWFRNGFTLTDIGLLAVEYFLKSLAFGYVWWKTGSLWTAVVLHTSHNLMINLGL